MKNVVFFGSSKLIYPLIQTLQNSFHLALVITTENNSTDPVPSYCKKNNISFISIKDKIDPETVTTIKNTHAEVGVLADFGVFITKQIMEIFPKGIINVHPSLLPKYRGPTPVQTALRDGQTTTGITLIKLDSEIDHGPILTQQEEKILPDDTALSLHERLFAKSAFIVKEMLPKYLEGKLQMQAQDHKKATFTEHLTRHSGYIDPSSFDTHDVKLEIARKIRAYYPWPGVWTKINLRGQEVRVKLLPNNMVQVEGKKPMTYKDFLNGYPEIKSLIDKLS